jgi:sulfite reductase beta subunit-like hemoprotein
MKTAQSTHIADWADSYGSGELMFTNRQNVEIRNVPKDRVAELLAEISKAGLRTAGHERLPDMVACVGTTVCRMAAGDTPAAYHRIMDDLADDRQLWEKVGPLRVNLTGCPNNCAHAWIADIGLRGKRMRNPEGGSMDGFDIFVGGKLSEAGRIAECIGNAPGEQVVPTIRRILQFYLDNRSNAGERFIDFCERTPAEAFTTAMLA